MKRFFQSMSVILWAVCLSACNVQSSHQGEDVTKAGSTTEPSKFSQTLYHGGIIITMEGATPQYVESVVQRDGEIVFVGSKQEALKTYAGKATEFDLKGRTMMPGFIEPHAHPVSIGAFILGNDIVAPHEWKMPHKTYPAAVGKKAYLQALKNIVDSKEDKDDYVLVWGYHQSWHGPLYKEDLNSVSETTPVLIFHRSGHEYYLNDAAMTWLDVKTDEFENQDQIDPDNNHFWERGFAELRSRAINDPVYGDKERLSLGLERMSTMMLQNGLTAMAEPSFPNGNFQDEYALLKAETEKSPFYDMYLIPGFPEQYSLKMSNDDFDAYIKKMNAFDTDHIKFMTDQVKTFSDGAIYSLALQLLDGFENCPKCHAEWIIPPNLHKDLFDFYWDKGYKIHTHVTGDKGLEVMLNIVEEAMARNPRKDHRTTLHHLGLVSEQQAQRMADLNIEASVNSYYLWALGNKYGETGFGPERAGRIAPSKWLTERGIPTSYHSDFAMAPAEPLTLAWVATTRMTDSGEIMRPELGVSVYMAMRGITIDAARTIDMEEKIGSIKKGKVANFTLLEQNPFKVGPLKIKDIPVDGIVYRGTYKKSPTKHGE